MLLGMAPTVCQDVLLPFNYGVDTMPGKIYCGLISTLGMAAFAILLNLATPATARAQHAQATPVMQAYFRMVFAGDIKDAPALFQAEPDDHLTPMLESQFESRFVQRSNGLDLSALTSPEVRQIMALYQEYWRDALMQTAPLVQLEAALSNALDQILVQQGFESSADDIERLQDNVVTFIEQKGYFALAGRTPPLLELMIWTKNEANTESIELTDGIHPVEVNFLDDFVSYGWSNFATFGMTSTGGWANRDGLFCLCGHYDLDSEKYKLSFLKHEARHYVDFSLYPELQPSDLEYRSKLTELAFSDEETYTLIRHFSTSANNVPNAPHPLANWYVVDNLSRHLFDGEVPAEAITWESIPKEDIRQTALLLLQENDAALRKQGAATTTGVINYGN